MDKKSLILLSIYVLLSILFGASVFFTFIFGPALFAGLEARNAGQVMNLIFPYYFKLGWIGGIIIYTLVGLYSYFDKSAIKTFKYFLIALFFIVIINMALDRAILPLANAILSEYYELLEHSNVQQANVLKEKFNILHKISSTLNIAYILILFYSMYLLFKNIRKG